MGSPRGTLKPSDGRFVNRPYGLTIGCTETVKRAVREARPYNPYPTRGGRGSVAPLV